MPKRYSEMTLAELHAEIARLTEECRKAEQLGRDNEYAVAERKITMAKAYLLDPYDFQPGDVFELVKEPGVSFKINYLDGVFAWGRRLSENDDEEAIPISLLILKD